MFGSSRYKIAKRHRVPISKGYKKQTPSYKKAYIKNTKRSFI